MNIEPLKRFFERLFHITYPHTRVGEIWVCKFNGYPVSGEVIQSTRTFRYDHCKLKEIYIHTVRVNNCHNFNKIHHWKEIKSWEKDKSKFRLK